MIALILTHFRVITVYGDRLQNANIQHAQLNPSNETAPEVSAHSAKKEYQNNILLIKCNMEYFLADQSIQQIF